MQILRGGGVNAKLEIKCGNGSVEISFWVLHTIFLRVLGQVDENLINEKKNVSRAQNKGTLD